VILNNYWKESFIIFKNNTKIKIYFCYRRTRAWITTI
jgi:hypothetical protein